ncbi:DUF3014 domain-containing protein [Myxococcus sp. K15C18031901]|uniref:DUF3014 domain-containing protein n=1 Tax=Myxococcus dinghuensis TaxID=2906761 RepID=UPI0020A71EBF|nr:DUF3014 domain-containing protein [Myxococcus dinghuensis]MCP3099336.1 DUF3014 domain-containing protein [Myxococcus dinghuensis]
MSDPVFAGGPMTPPPPEEPPRTGGSGWVAGGVVAAIVVAGGAGAWFFYRGTTGTPGPSPEVPVVVTPQDAGVVAAQPTVSLPESDGKVRDLAGRLSDAPELAAWLQERDLARRVAAAVNNVAEGASPRMVLGFLGPAEPFVVVEAKDHQTLTIDPKSHARYDTVARVFGSLDAQAAGSLYRELKPLLVQAHAELAPPGQGFDATLGRSIQHLLAVPVPEGAPVEVKAQGALYAYVSPELEGLSRAQKHLLRMGPQNIRVIQAKLRELQTALGLPSVAER